MKYNISAFTHIGTKREVNQDRILVNDKVIEDDFYHLKNQDQCFCFVADGIGGGVRGEIASQFVLKEMIAYKDRFMLLDEIVIDELMTSINNELISYSLSKPEYSGTGTTLTGLIINTEEESLTLNAGDSEIRVLRNNMFFQITDAQVYDGSNPNSPLISYFGGKEESLDLSMTSSLRSINSSDIYVIASDGLFDSLSPKTVKEILTEDKALPEKAETLLKTALKLGSDDNISCVLIEVV